MDDNSDEFLDGLFELLRLVEVKEQKSILNFITEKVEYLSLKNGNYKQVEELIKEVKEKIEKL